MLRDLEFRPEGETTFQPRATPWEPGFQGSACPVRAPQFSAVAMSQSHVKNRILFRPFRAGTWLLGVVPGRCPGLICDCPFGATTRRRQHQNLRVGLVWDPRVRKEREMVIPSTPRIDVARSGIPPRRGNNISAQGNALGTGIPRKRMPCKGATILGCCDVAVAREKPHSVSPFQGRDVAA